ncbi:uncharacterized protein LOC107792992 [Nicotiana tabacum]|uniref:Uncharacterized protein LOC107792992 n=1 Tax=Nicotiana tabacum TaxID=4097 RepID=A0A1S4A234_TOBAC|nr:uncharacterized protein LOC104085036 [Nicotiana tomentosiformis]XP_016470747.1 PREDICTED: uncharacterized protein LOC107792992 [Nicotiana tabacum]
MGRHIISGSSTPPISSVAPAVSGGVEGGEDSNHWRSFDNSVNAVSFGFVATAILISMFLVMAIFERFLRRRSSSSGGRSSTDLVAQMRVQRKLDYPSPEMTFYANGVSVLMPGEEVPTFIAHPAPPPCPPECISQPRHQDDDASSSPALTSIGHILN